MSARPRLSLILPTRKRLANLERLCHSLVRTAAAPEALEVVLVVDEDDPESASFTHPGLHVRPVVVPPGLTMGALNQAGYLASGGEFVMLLNDDVVVRTARWDEQVLRHARTFADGIVLVHVNDTLMRDNLCTFPLVSRTFCNLAGGICPPSYQRYCIDDHVEDVFNLLFLLGERRAVYLPEVVFEHLNAVEFPGGHREYHADPAILALDQPRFRSLFEQRKQLALRILDHVEPACPEAKRAERRRLLESVHDPLTLRRPGRQRVIESAAGRARRVAKHLARTVRRGLARVVKAMR